MSSTHAFGSQRRRSPQVASAPGLPVSVGLGLRREYVDELVSGAIRADFVEIHAENFMSDGGPNLRLLDRIAEAFPLSIHGVGLSIGSADELDKDHLGRVQRLCKRAKPAMVSEHLAWSVHGGIYFNDLLPIPLNSVSLQSVVAHVDEVQDTLGRRILIENPSTYFNLESSDWDEIDFLREMARRSGCGLLLDVNNVYVSCQNQNLDSRDYIARFPLELVGELHLAGFERSETILIDTHGRAIAEPVWDLFEGIISCFGPLPTLIERDNNVPPIAELDTELRRAANALSAASRRAFA
jgi:uncharacterized protein